MQELGATMKSSKQITILQLNDSHAYLDLHQELFWQGECAIFRPVGGYARIATLVKQIREERAGRVLFCDCGDTFHGTRSAVKSRGKALLPIVNALGLDAMTAHWEFAYGPRGLQELARELTYPVLAANVHDVSSRTPVFPSFTVKEVGGLRIGMVGIASNIVDKTMPPHFSEGVRFTQGKEELQAAVEHLRTREKVDLSVLISHLGFPQDMKLLSEVPGVDVCLSGHTHNRLHHPVLNGTALLIQSGCHGSFLGRLDLEVEERRIVQYHHQLIEVTADILPDPAVSELVDQALAPYREELSLPVGVTATALHRGTILEATMDNLLLQALRETAGTQLAFSNGWRYGAPVVPGQMVLNDLYNMVPMDPPVSTVELTGEEISQMLEENLERTFSCDPYRQMGGYVKRCLGLQVYFKLENPPGHRIQRIFTSGEDLEPDRSYTAAFVTEQGVPRRFGRQRKEHPEHAIAALRTYLRGHRPVDAELRGTFLPI